MISWRFIFSLFCVVSEIDRFSHWGLTQEQFHLWYCSLYKKQGVLRTPKKWKAINTIKASSFIWVRIKNCVVTVGRICIVHLLAQVEEIPEKLGQGTFIMKFLASSITTLSICTNYSSYRISISNPRPQVSWLNILGVPCPGVCLRQFWIIYGNGANKGVFYCTPFISSIIVIDYPECKKVLFLNCSP